MQQVFSGVDIVTAWCFTGIAAVMAVAVTVFYTLRVAKVCKTVKAQSSSSFPEELPSVSVIVYSNGDASGLATLLRQLREQSYQAPWEVIVVNDGKDYETDMLLMSVASQWSLLRHTFTPKVMRNVSRKKLALTLGMKAARHDVVVHVTSSSRIKSPDWLKYMAMPFNNPSIDLVIGYACPDPADDTRRGSRRRAHDMLVTSVHYLASALTAHTYRGDGDNLAYRRDKFFEMKGFSNSLNLHYGDDDIFVSDVATPSNTAVMIARDAQVMTSTPHPVEVYKAKKYRYDYTARYCDCSQNWLYDTVSLLMWLWLLSTVGAVLIAFDNWLVMSVLGVVALLLWLPQMLVWRKASLLLSSRRFMLSVPGSMLWRPFYNFIYHLRSRRIHTAHFTWQAIGNQQ